MEHSIKFRSMFSSKNRYRPNQNNNQTRRQQLSRPRNRFYSKKKSPLPTLFSVVPGSKSKSKSKSISKSKSKSKSISKSKSKSVKQTTYVINKNDIIFLDDTDDIYTLKVEIDRLNTLNEELTHQIFNLKEKLENSNKDIDLCRVNSSEKEKIKDNARLNDILKKLKEKIINDIGKKLENNQKLKTKILRQLEEVKQTQSISAQSSQITSDLQIKAAEKLPRMLLGFVSSRLANKVSLLCSNADSYLTPEEISTIADMLINIYKN